MSHRQQQKGQILPLFAGGVIGLVAVAALILDVANVYSLQRMERSAADESALAGAQDLQTPGSRAVGFTDYSNARTHALANLASKLGATSAPSCPPTSDIVDCVIPGTPYWVSIKTPSPSWVNVDRNRAIQVTVRQHDVPLTFARVFGQHNWNVAMTSVAGLGYGKSYAVITLRPPKPSGSTFNVNDIILNSSVVNVNHGDVGTNANMNYSGTGARMNIDTGYGMYYFDPTGGPGWAGPPIPPAQIVQKLPDLIRDPGYRYPDMTGAPTFNDVRISEVVSGTSPPTLGVERADKNPACLALANTVPHTSYSFVPSPVTVANGVNIYCYKPGIYESLSGAMRAQISVGPADIALLYPGAYYLRSGLSVNGRLLGGFVGGNQGVALMFDESGPSNCPQCVFNGNSALTIALNAGTKFPPPSGGVAATAAIDWAGVKVDTGTLGPTIPLIMTVLVRYDTNDGGTQGCFVPTSAPFVERGTCLDSKNQTISVGGGGQLALEGVQYAPSDNATVAGGSGSVATVGQFISWTLVYDGNSTFNQEGPAADAAGIIHLDAACSGGNSPCSP